MLEKAMLKTNLPKLKFIKSGKVRDIYDLGDYYLIVSTDRLSAFDVIMNQGIPYKGIALSKISNFWFNFCADVIENHLVEVNVEKFPAKCLEYKAQLIDRSMLVKKTKTLPIECIVRGYISGSGWEEYKKSGTVCGIKLPSGLIESDKLPEPIFTPSTKAEIGEHDENINEEKAIKIIGENNYFIIKNAALSIYKKAYEYAYKRNIIIADTKMEFGTLGEKIILIDELLTPDSSRFWPLDGYKAGGSQDSFDKQYVRDYLLSIKFNKQPPPPDLPQEVITNTYKKYVEIYEILTGDSFNET